MSYNDFLDNTDILLLRTVRYPFWIGNKNRLL